MATQENSETTGRQTDRQTDRQTGQMEKQTGKGDLIGPLVYKCPERVEKYMGPPIGGVTERNPLINLPRFYVALLWFKTT